MKKSKIIGLSLGLTALTATAVATTVITTSCSTVDENLLVAKVATGAFDKINVSDKLTPPATESSKQQENGDQQQPAEQKYQVITDQNTATIYIKNSKFIDFTLSTEFAKVFELNKEQTEAFADYTAEAITWTAVDNDDYTLGTDNTFKTKKDLSTYKQDLISINLEGKVSFTKKQTPPVQGGDQQENNPTGKTTEQNTEATKYEKNISIKLFIRRGYYGKDGYVAPTQPTTSTTK